MLPEEHAHVRHDDRLRDEGEEHAHRDTSRINRDREDRAILKNLPPG